VGLPGEIRLLNRGQKFLLPLGACGELATEAIQRISGFQFNLVGFHKRLRANWPAC